MSHSSNEQQRAYYRTKTALEARARGLRLEAMIKAREARAEAKAKAEAEQMQAVGYSGTLKIRRGDLIGPSNAKRDHDASRN